MAEPYIEHGDSEALVIHVLRNLTPELVGKSITFSSDLVGYSAGNRWVMVTQEGSSKAQWNVINKPRIDVEVRAERRTVAKRIAEIAEASIFRAVGTAAYGAFLSQVKEEMGITRIPDKEEDNTARYVFSVRIVTTLDPSSLPSFPT